MQGCQLDYIPERLYWKEGQDKIQTCAIDDILYRRAPEQLIENPFGTISLADLSHNIGTNHGRKISKMEDVLYSIKEEEDFIKYPEEVISLKFISLNDQDTYDKIYTDTKNDQLKVRIRFLHDPVECMYPHCVFQFFVFDNPDHEGMEVTFQNYKRTLGQNKFRRLRTRLRQELAKMIIRESISYKEMD